MHAIHRGTAATNSPKAVVVARPSKKTQKAGSSVDNICARAHFSRLKAEFKTLLAALSMSMVSACTAWQTQESTLEQISTLNNMRYTQLLTNLSEAVDQLDSIPSTGVPSSGTATTVATGGLALTLTQPFAFTNNTKTFTPTATLNWQNNWTITPVSDPQDLQNLRALAGLLYYSDQDIWDFIANTLDVWNIKLSLQKTNREDPGAKITPKTNLTSVSEDCGISPPDYGSNTGRIYNATRAVEAYLAAWNAFPDYYSQVTLKFLFPLSKAIPLRLPFPLSDARLTPLSLLLTLTLPLRFPFFCPMRRTPLASQGFWAAK